MTMRTCFISIATCLIFKSESKCFSERREYIKTSNGHLRINFNIGMAYHKRGHNILGWNDLIKAPLFKF